MSGNPRVDRLVPPADHSTVPPPNELDVSALLSVRQAIDVLDAEPVTPRVVRLPIGKCRGLRLAQDVLADRDYPPFDKSLMDGYAVRAADVRLAPSELPVVGVVPAGHQPPRALGPGEAMAVMTGAPVPAGADCVVPVEQTEELGFSETDGGRVRINKGVTIGHALARRASDMPAGVVVLSRGTLLEAPALAVAASVGAAELTVYARPRVAVLGTGDEIVPVDQQPDPWQIRNSNNVMLVALLERLGCEVTDLGVAKDDPDAIRDAVIAGLAYDALFVTGGMSMGEFDYVPKVLVEQGVTLKVSKVRMKPGKPFVFGVKQGTEPPRHEGTKDEEDDPTLRASVPDATVPSSAFVFGLPGNPVSAFVCTLRMASRVLARLAGGEPRERWLTGRIDAGLPMNGPREFYQPVIRRAPAGLKSVQNELPAIELLNWKGSADVFTLAQANALLVRAENEPALPKGTMVRVLEL
jgi:molybdopterin molybdotransferase